MLFETEMHSPSGVVLAVEEQEVVSREAQSAAVVRRFILDAATEAEEMVIE